MSYYLSRKAIRRLPGIIIKAVPLPRPQITSGFAARAQVGALCRHRGFGRVLLVTDSSVKALGLAEKVEKSLADAGVAFETFAHISGEPTSDIIEKGRQAAIGFRADCLVGLGGGSVMDACKMMAAGARLKAFPVKTILLKFLWIPGKTLPIVNIPSTAGTGAETTVGAVVTDSRKNRKKSTVIIGLNVTDVVLDSELTLKMPRSITAACGIDALSHGLEGAVASVSCSQEDQWKSLECVRLVLECLPRVLNRPEDVQAREQMCLAAHYGGNAINCQLAGYVHAFAHSLGARYHISHGQAIARCLLPVLRAETPYCPGKMAAVAQHCGLSEANDSPETSVPALFDALDTLVTQCGFEAMPAIPEGDLDDLVKMIDSDSINYSAPVTFTDAQLKDILRQL